MPVAGRSKVWVCVRSLAGIGVGITPRAWMSVSCECCGCQVEVSASDHSSGGYLQTVLCLSDIWKFRDRRGHDRYTDRGATEQNEYMKWTR